MRIIYTVYIYILIYYVSYILIVRTMPTIIPGRGMTTLFASDKKPIKSPRLNVLTCVLARVPTNSPWMFSLHVAYNQVTESNWCFQSHCCFYLKPCGTNDSQFDYITILYFFQMVQQPPTDQRIRTFLQT